MLQGSNKVAFLYWYTYFRLIPIDAQRKHSEDPDPSFFGEELGRWDGDALVVDSIGFKDTQVWIDENANPHSDALHVVERWTRPDYDHIHVETLIEDPKFYTKPFNYSRTWVLGKPGEQVHEYACSENNVDRDHLQFGPGQHSAGRHRAASKSWRRCLRRCRKRNRKDNIAMKLSLVFITLGLGLATVNSALAHHSFAAEFDGNKPIRIQGTLSKIEWTNPHSWFYVDVKDDSGQRRDLGL